MVGEGNGGGGVCLCIKVRHEGWPLGGDFCQEAQPGNGGEMPIRLEPFFL